VPELSPIEPCWSKVKTGWRTAKARTRAALDTALSQALTAVTAVDACNWFRPSLSDTESQTAVNNVVEQDHRFVKRRVNPGLGFGAFATAQRTIQGYEAMHRLRKGQLKGVAKGHVLAQNRVINQLFGLAA
jgi:transposase-like protein